VLRMDLLAVLYRQFPKEKWVYASLKKLMPTTEALPAERLEPAFQALLDKNDEPRVRALAMFGVAECAAARGDQHGYERAIQLFTKVRDEFPDSEVRQAAEDGRAALARCMPGQPAPSKPATDSDGQTFSVADYKGRVVMLEFWSFTKPACIEAIPSRAALVQELSSKPFSMVGVNFDNMKPDAYRAQAAKAGIRWRSALVYFNHAVMDNWEVHRFPTTILIDKKGIIRGRDLPWNEMVALAKQLVDEPG
jgi:thiol-disulfide isomerase/thioredoxin